MCMCICVCLCVLVVCARIPPHALNLVHVCFVPVSHVSSDCHGSPTPDFVNPGGIQPGMILLIHVHLTIKIGR